METRGSSQHSCTGFAGVLHARIAGGDARDLDAIVETVLSGRHDRIPCAKTWVDQRAAIECFANDDPTDPHSTIRLYGEDIGTVLALLYRAQRHGDAVMPIGHVKMDIDEFAGPKSAACIR